MRINNFFFLFKFNEADIRYNNKAIFQRKAIKKEKKTSNLIVKVVNTRLGFMIGLSSGEVVKKIILGGVVLIKQNFI